MKKAVKEKVAEIRKQNPKLSRRCARCKAMRHENKRPCGKKDCEEDKKEAYKQIAQEAKMSVDFAGKMLQKLDPTRCLDKFKGFDLVVANPPFCAPNKYAGYK